MQCTLHGVVICQLWFVCLPGVLWFLHTSVVMCRLPPSTCSLGSVSAWPGLAAAPCIGQWVPFWLKIRYSPPMLTFHWQWIWLPSTRLTESCATNSMRNQQGARPACGVGVVSSLVGQPPRLVQRHPHALTPLFLPTQDRPARAGLVASTLHASATAWQAGEAWLWAGF